MFPSVSSCTSSSASGWTPIGSLEVTDSDILKLMEAERPWSSNSRRVKHLKYYIDMIQDRSHDTNNMIQYDSNIQGICVYIYMYVYGIRILCTLYNNIIFNMVNSNLYVHACNMHIYIYIISFCIHTCIYTVYAYNVIAYYMIWLILIDIIIYIYIFYILINIENNHTMMSM